MRGALALAVLMSASGAALAQGKPSPCPALLNHLDALAKAAGVESAESALDDSAPRETTRQLRLLRYSIERATTMTQMSAAGCKLPVEPLLSENAYHEAAMGLPHGPPQGERSPQLRPLQVAPVGSVAGV